MSDQELSTKVAAILSKDHSLTVRLLTQPSAMLIPFMKSREAFYLLASLTFDDSKDAAIEATRMCATALKLLVNSGIADDLAGIEVVPYLRAKDKTRRLFRLSVLRSSFDIALNLHEQDLLNDKPAEALFITVNCVAAHEVHSFHRARTHKPGNSSGKHVTSHKK